MRLLEQSAGLRERGCGNNRMGVGDELDEQGRGGTREWRDCGSDSVEEEHARRRRICVGECDA